jgi:2-polyprenyl-3-methyl-5-hydroxy-6-metoxy-1,4-benzoquinol methylase
MSKNNQRQRENLVALWNRVADAYEHIDYDGPDYKANLQILLECTGEPRNKTYCEVGSGTGTTSAMLASLGANVTLIDHSPKALSFTKSLFSKLHLKGNYCLMDAFNLGITVASFDVVWNGGVIEHFYDSDKINLIREMWRILRPGGVLCILAPNQFDLPFVLYKFVAERLGLWPYGFEDDLTPSRLERLSQQAGLAYSKIFSYNPVVGWWFIPFGKIITQKLGLNTVRWHAKRSRRGHVVCMTAHKIG